MMEPGLELDAKWISFNANIERIVDTNQRLDKIGALLESASTRTATSAAHAGRLRLCSNCR
jgi:hypothetical protein